LECGRNAPSESRATNQADCASTGGLPGVGGGGTVKCRRGSSRGDAVEGYWRFPADYITARNAHFLCPTDASPTKTRSGSCGLSKRLHPKAQCSSRLLSWGSFKDRPSADVTDAPTSRLNRSSSFDPSIANTRVQSVHVGSHDSDGSPRTSLRVCCAPQPAIGFARFPTTAEAVVFPTGAHPSKLFPRRQLKTRHRASCPLVVVRVVR